MNQMPYVDSGEAEKNRNFRFQVPVAGEIKSKGNDDETGKKQEARQRVKEQYTTIQKSLEQHLFDFYAEAGRLPNLNEARTLYAKMKNNLAKVSFVEPEMFGESLNEAGYVETGKSLSLALDGGGRATFELVYASNHRGEYAFQLWPTERDDEASKNAKRIREV